MHTCPAPGCSISVPFNMLACKPHWFSIPKPLRDQLWKAYRDHGVGSDEHDEAIQACVEYLREAASFA